MGAALPRAMQHGIGCAFRRASCRARTQLEVAGWQLRSYAAPDARLDLPALDGKWRQRWATLLEAQTAGEAARHRTDKPKYILPMFPYPSGHLHLGHLRVYTVADVVARFHGLRGSDVVLPIGWDAFGLPAENAAMDRGVHPATWTRANIGQMKTQLRLINASFDWSRELATCDPAFYKHTQSIFLLLYEQGLAYQAEAAVNWDPVDRTVLANEQVDDNGCSWRSGAKVERRVLKQWFLRLTALRDSLLEDLDSLAKDKAWPERVLAQQRNWIGRSAGALVKFPVLALDRDVGAAIEVFTTRLDTLPDVQYVALAATHPLVRHLAAEDPELQAFLGTLLGQPPDSKVGYLLPRLRVVDPLTFRHHGKPEDADHSIPVYVAAYVIGDYGVGAVMGVPAHDVRDHAFWEQQGGDEPVRVVLAASEDGSTTVLPNSTFASGAVLAEQGGPLRAKTPQQAAQQILTLLADAGLAQPAEKWRLRDWLVSRQRYWGTPIPMIHCDACGAVPVPKAQLPVELPPIEHHWADRKTGSPLESLDDWVKTTCPACAGPARRDTDTMDTFVDSSWYYMRFADPHNSDAPFSQQSVVSMLPVDTYIGGVEHAILHLLYARFMYKVLMQSDLAPDSKGAVHEPFRRLITQGMVLGKTFTNPASGRFLKPDELDLSDPGRPQVVATGEPATVSFEKMSKSKYNGLDPTDVITRHGADATRAHMLFQAPVGDTLCWDENKISGVTRWLGRVHHLAVRIAAHTDGEPATDIKSYLEQSAASVASMSVAARHQWNADATVWRCVQKTIQSVTESYTHVYSLNTAVSGLMTLTNKLVQHGDAAGALVQRAAISSLIRMMAPITPALAEECWSLLFPSCAPSIFKVASFPVSDGTLPLLQRRLQPCAVQVNGKFRFAVDIIPPGVHLQGDALMGFVVKQVLETKQGRALTKNPATDPTRARKVLVVKAGKLVNFVFKDE